MCSVLSYMWLWNFIGLTWMDFQSNIVMSMKRIPGVSAHLIFLEMENVCSLLGQCTNKKDNTVVQYGNSNPTKHCLHCLAGNDIMWGKMETQDLSSRVIFFLYSIKIKCLCFFFFCLQRKNTILHLCSWLGLVGLMRYSDPLHSDWLRGGWKDPLLAG